MLDSELEGLVERDHTSNIPDSAPAVKPLTTHPPLFVLSYFRDSALPFDHPNRPHPRHFVRQPRAMHHFHHVIDILVRLRLLLRESLVALGASDDALRFQFSI